MDRADLTNAVGKTMADHDHGYKRLFSHPEMIRDLLLGFVPDDWIAELDFTTLEKYPTEFVDDRLRNRRSDVIWRVRWGKNWLYLYLLLEFQSGVSGSWRCVCSPISICCIRI